MRIVAIEVLQLSEIEFTKVLWNFINKIVFTARTFYHLLDMDEIKISSNWEYEDDNKLKNLVTYIQSDNKKCDIEHVTPETCICLTKGENDSTDSKPELNISLKCGFKIKELNVFSEGSLIEVFGVHDEYLFTSAAEFVDDWGGMAVYHAKIVLPGVNTCKLKFTRIKENGRLWLYSVQLSVIKPEEPSNHLLFNFENVNKLINNSSQQISEKAEKFKKFFEFYAKNSSNAQPFNVQTLLNVINKECNVQFSDCKTFANLMSANETLNRKESNSMTKNELSVENQFIKSYIDKKFVEMKEDLMSCIESKLAEIRDETNTRLDHIIKLLENSQMQF